MRKVTAFGSNEKEFIANFDARRQEKVYSCEIAGGNDVAGKFLSNSSNMLLEMGSSQGMWIRTAARGFANQNWLPMLADTGHKVGEGSYGEVYVIDTDMGNLPDRDISVAIKKEIEQ